ncbi:conserved hypothetical protein [Leishmania braziliensis MHOM/BR/75/M2904]|uniref:Uncharacterized protein n=2 Tax=Leishmania braziliensis TaxID=5660 RepID=A4H6T8_LEIBR|nr:conserved hypothetical protein [Leishmania braziliensis MHOM/BR/75/M2904]CAJ2468370.1 unnamed protein product [Leishmania braziliensis]CAM37398.1 conserved hypothetical protein [Leishmania braziliensis MHOM/BR/75/M2904]SYZ63720.1 hypothetical_protein [Leishmania braziliensis MHOM/BR/75/M2904]
MSASSNLEKLLPSLYEFLSVHPSDAYAPASAAPTQRSGDDLYPGCSSDNGRSNATSPSAISSSSLGSDLACATPAIIVQSYTRWRRCITVWRRVIGNDSLFLTVLLHAGCLWCPNYAALYRAKRDITTRAQQQRRSAQATPASEDKSALEVGSATLEGEQGSLVLRPWTTATSDTPHNSPVKRRSKRGGKVAAETAAHSISVLAAAVDVHAELAAMCPASVWALHVLHFLRVEEVCTVPSSGSKAKSVRHGNMTRTNSETSSYASWSPHGDSGDSSENEFSSTSSNSRTSRSGSRDSHSSIESARANSDRTSDAVDGCIASGRKPAAGRGWGGGRRRGGRGDGGGSGQRGMKRQNRPERAERHLASSTSGDRTRRRRRDGERACEGRLPFDASWTKWAASSSLLPKLSKNEGDGGGGGDKHLRSTLAAVLSVLQQQEQQRVSARLRDGTVDGDVGETNDKTPHGRGEGFGAGYRTCDCGNSTLNGTSATAEQKHALLLRATITLVSEEEPLVQQVATALVNEWLDLMSVETSTPQSRVTTTSAPTEVMGEVTTLSDGSAPRRRSGLPRTQSSSCADASVQALHHHRLCDARNYWLSCLLKMVAYLDGVHSALREENIHMSAVLARQGIAPQDAEDIFTKSLPAIFNCVLVEEALHSAATALPASQPRTFTTWATSPLLASACGSPALRLWMPPPALLLPFHLIGRGSVFGVWVPPGVAARQGSIDYLPALASTRTSTRAHGRFVSYVIDSHGLHLGTEPYCRCGALVPESKSVDTERRGGVEALQSCKRASVGVNGQDMTAHPRPPRHSSGHCRLGFAVRCTEPESLLETHYLTSLEYLLPVLRVPDVKSQQAANGDLPRDQLEQQPALRWWTCTLNETVGTPRMDVYASRTLLMLPIPTQNTLDSTAGHAASSARVDAGTTTNTLTVGGTHHAETRAKSGPSALASSSTTVGARKRPRGGFHRGPTVSAEEQAVRRQHPLLYHAMRLQLRAGKFACKGGSGGSESGDTELVLLYGHPRGEETTTLRHMGFTVRTGSHHRLGRGGAAFARRMDLPAGSSVTELNSGVGGGRGRLTLSRDALGTTLEGMYLIARRVLGLQGLFVSSASALTTPAAAAAAAEARASGKGSPSVTGAAALGDGDACASLNGTTVTHMAASTLGPQTEKEALGTVAATLALMCLVLSHSLLDDLLEQPFLVLWTTELASFVLDVSLLMPRPLPRLLKADGFALALLPQPAQSLLLMVGLAATLVTREVHMAAASNQGSEGGDGSSGGRGRGAGGTSSTSTSTIPQSHPWWFTFRSTVLRDTELPSCLYSGVWPIVEKAEATLATLLAEARRDTSGNRQASDGRHSHPSLPVGSDGGEEYAGAGAPMHVSGRGGRRGGAGGRRVLSLSAPSPPTAAGRQPPVDALSTSSSKNRDVTPHGSTIDRANPYGHRLLLKESRADGAPGELSVKATLNRNSNAAACGAGSVVSADQSYVPRRLCGHAVLCQDDGTWSAEAGSSDTHAASRALPFAEGVRVVSGIEVALLRTSSAHVKVVSPLSRMFSLSLSGVTLLPQLTAAFASALWVSLEAEEMYSGTSAA